jgi:hypothetical protein
MHMNHEEIRAYRRSMMAKYFPKYTTGRAWRKSNFSMPAPFWVKQGVLAKYGSPIGTWIETGTFQGDTTAFLSQRATKVFTIEPSPQLAALAEVRFANTKNVTVVTGLSEDVLDDVLDSVQGKTSFWLDGHFSAGNTYKGPIDTPIVRELAVIQARMSQFSDLSVLIDDIRLFDPTNEEFADYPSRSYLVSWADNCGLKWVIEHDIFCAFRKDS